MPDKPRTWDQFAIKAELHRRGMTLTKLAEINKLNPGTFRAVWKRPNQKVERAIARFLKVPVELLFPGRYPKRTNTILSREYAAESTGEKTTKDAA